MSAPVGTYLADKSALARLRDSRVRSRLGPLFLAGEIATCSVVDLEVLYSARNFADYEAILDERLGLPRVIMTEQMFERAIDVQHALARRGHHRIPIPDLLIAAAAEHDQLAVLHYDADFDRIAAVTGQRAVWVAPAGSLN